MAEGHQTTGPANPDKGPDENFSSNYVPSSASSTQNDASFVGSHNRSVQIGQNLAPIYLSTERAERSDASELRLPLGLQGIQGTKHFIGRAAELFEIQRNFKNGTSERKTVVLQGMGGVGKTQLAVAYATGNSHKYLAVIWLNGTDEYSLCRSFATAAGRLGVEHPDSTTLQSIVSLKKPDEIARGLVQWLGASRNKEWLLLFDNVDHPWPSRRSGAYDISRFIPIADHGHVIVTSRLARLDIGTTVVIKPLQDVQVGLTILAKTSGRQNVAEDPDAEALVRRLGGLPLAITTSGALLSQTSLSFAKYLQSYEASWSRLSAMTLSTDQNRTLWTAWDLSFEMLQEDSPSAAALLRLWTYLDSADLRYDLLAAGHRDAPALCPFPLEDELAFHAVARRVCEYGFAEPVPASGGYSCHRCVHDWVREVARGDADATLHEFAILCVGLSLPDPNEHTNFQLYPRLISHARMAVATIPAIRPDHSPGLFLALHRLGTLFLWYGNVDTAETLFHTALKGREAECGPDDELANKTVNNLGIVYKARGKAEEAEAMFQRAMATRERVLGPEHPHTLDAAMNLAHLYTSYNRDGAEALYLRALAGYEKRVGAKHPDALFVRHNLGVLYKNQGRIAEAESMYQQAWDGRRAALGPDHPSTLDAMSDLANLYPRRGTAADVEAMLQRVLQGQQKNCGDGHPSTLDARSNLGSFYRQIGRQEEGERLAEQAFVGYERICGPDHLSTRHMANNLAAVRLEQSRPDEAASLCERTLAHGGGKGAWGVDGKLEQAAAWHLGSAYRMMGRPDESEAMFKRALMGSERLYGSDHVLTIGVYNNVGILYRDQGRWAEAEEAFQKAAVGYEQASGPNHARTLTTKRMLAELVAERNKAKETAPLS